MMMEPRSTATIRALASLAELSANQLEEGVSVEDVIATLRRAAEAVRSVVDADEAEDGESEAVQDLDPMEIAAASGEDEDAGDEADLNTAEFTILNAG